MVAFWIQFWHHIEHFLLILQATTHHNFWGKPVPCSVLQLIFPRVELHLFYNSIVFIPMVDRHVLPHVPTAGSRGIRPALASGAVMIRQTRPDHGLIEEG